MKKILLFLSLMLMFSGIASANWLVRGQVGNSILTLQDNGTITKEFNGNPKKNYIEKKIVYMASQKTAKN